MKNKDFHPSHISKLVRLLVPVVAYDIRLILAAFAHRIPERAGANLLRQIDYVIARPTPLDRGYKYDVSALAPKVTLQKGEIILGVAEVCYFQQIMPFTISLLDGLVYSVETREPRQLIEGACKEMTVFSVSINPEIIFDS